MIWLASFPRSGNTFIRNILYEVYGIASSTFHYQTEYPVDLNYDQFSFVKTHELPQLLKPTDISIPSVYIVRDGRDALVSMAHHRKDIIAPGSDFYQNLKEAIIADHGSFFGGWSKNVEQWILKSNIIIRYEDLIKDPIGSVERIRQLYDLPKPQIEKLPSFEKLKNGIPKYGADRDRNISDDQKKEKSSKFFRKGKSGGWKEEMPDDLHNLFWSYHGETMEKLGYTYEGEIVTPHVELDSLIRAKLGLINPIAARRKYKILIESNKVVSPDNDGVKRYQIELLKGFLPLVENPESSWEIDLYVHGEIFPLVNFKEKILKNFQLEDTLGSTKHSHKDKSVFECFEQLLVKLIPLKFIKYLERKEIKIFHRTYNFLKKILFLVMSMTFGMISYIKLFLYRIYHHTTGQSVEISSGKNFKAYDLIHLPLMHHYPPFINTRSKIITTVHDMTHISFPQFHTKINISNSKKGLDFILNSKSEVIAVSNSTKNDFLSECKIDPEKVHMIYEAADRQKFNFRINTEDTRKVRKKYGIGDIDNYIVCLSTIEPRKNLENTIKGFKLLLKENPGIPLNLVIAGKKGWETTKLLLSEAFYGDSVFFTGFIDDEDISAIYSDALAMSYLSFYEGFGLPPLEAMCCGTPVIFGNNSSLIEVVGKGGLPCDPYDINDIKEKFGQIYFDKELRNKKSREALKQSLNFSWRKTVVETLDIYNRIIEQ